MPKNIELRERFLELRIEGKTFSSISEELGVSKQTLINWSKDPKLKEVLSFGKLMRLQAILEKYQLSREASLEKLCILSQRILKEVEKRDLSQISTDRLIKILLGLHNKIQDLKPTPIHFQDKSPFDNPMKLGEFTFDVLD